jgi:hypothetical protein
MADRELNIKVNLIGGKQTEQELERIKLSGQGVGETFGAVSDDVKKSSAKITDGIGEIGESAKESSSSIGDMSEKTSASFMAMAAPVVAAGYAFFELYETLRSLNKEVIRSELVGEAYRASLTEMTSLVEELADAEVTLTKAEAERFRVLAQQSQEPIEQAELIEEENVNLIKNLYLLKKKEQEVLRLQKLEKLGHKLSNITKQQILMFEETERQEIPRLERAIQLRRDEAAALREVGSEARRVLEIEKEGALKASPKNLRELRAKERDLLMQAELARGEAQKDSLEMQRKTAIFATQKKVREIKAIEDVGRAVINEAVQAEQEKLVDTLIKIEEDFNKKKKAEREKAAKSRRDRLAREKAERRRALSEAFQIDLVEIEHMRLKGAKAEELARMRYEAELKLADDNANRRLMVEKRYQNQRLSIQIQADAEAEQERQRIEEERKRQEEHRRSFILETQEFDISMMKMGTDRELAEIELKYRREREMKQRSEEEITELTRRYNIERAQIEERAVNAQINRIGEVTDHLGSGLASAAYSALVFGDSFQESTARVIGGLGQQAAVEALISTAKGIAASVLNPAAAGAHFAAAAQFGVAAAVAGVASAGLSGGGGGGGGASAVSPTGSPQIAPTPEREQAESSSMVFNINFGGAVIYDSKQAAEQAMADRITRLQNTQRRGAPRRRS